MSGPGQVGTQPQDEDGPTSFPEHVDRRVREALAGPQGLPADVYAVSFYVYDEEDDPMRPTLLVGWNTEAQVDFALTAPPNQRPHQWWTPVDPLEARWNYAFWLQGGPTIGDSKSDQAGSALRKAWLQGLNVWLPEPDDDDDVAFEAYVQKGRQASQLFVQLCVEQAQRLHRDGTIASLFGRPIPVLVHGLEYYDAIAEQAREANPSGLADGFIAWVNNLGHAPD